MKTRNVLHRFITSRRAMGLAHKSLRWYKGMLEPFSRLNGELPDDPEIVEQFLGALNVTDETRHGYYRALRAFYRWANKRYSLVNPMEDIRPPRRKKKHPWSLTVLELALLMAVPLSDRDRALLWLLIDTGVRIGEALGLVRDDIQEDTIFVSGKTGHRYVPISPETREQLLALGNPRIFMGPKGPLTESGAYRVIKLAFKAAGIAARKWGPHSLRHTFGRHYILAGGDLVSLQRIMGHADIKTTRIYVELDLRDVTHQHRRFSPLKMALNGHQGQNVPWHAPAPVPVRRI